MKLEKATFHSNEASLAGWISSNDVTLLTMVLVVMIALFLHSKLVKGAKENAALAGENTTLVATLDSTQSELHSERTVARHASEAAPERGTAQQTGQGFARGIEQHQRPQ